MVVPLLGDDRVVVERQWRYPMGRAMLEFPAGKLEPGEPVLDCAVRELIEETGYRAAEWARAGILHNAIGYSNEGDRGVVRARPRRRRAPASTPASSSMSSSASVDELEDARAPRRDHRRQDADRAALARPLARRPLALAVGAPPLSARLTDNGAMKVLEPALRPAARLRGLVRFRGRLRRRSRAAASSPARCAATRQAVRLPSAPRLNVSRHAAPARAGPREPAPR